MRYKSIRYIPVLLLWIFLYYYKEASTNFIVYNWIALPYESTLSDTIWFFISTLQKIFLLLVLVIFLTGIVRTWFSPEKTRKLLEGKSLLTGNIFASLLGIVTPFLFVLSNSPFSWVCRNGNPDRCNIFVSHSSPNDK